MVQSRSQQDKSALEVSPDAGTRKSALLVKAAGPPSGACGGSDGRYTSFHSLTFASEHVLLLLHRAGNGFFINTALLMFSMLVNAWLCLLLVLLSGVSRNSTVLDDSLAVVGGLQLLQLGSLSLLVYIATVWLEDGFFTTIKNVLKQFVAGSMLFYIFRGQTSAHAFRSDLAFGGATYAATGRGYKLKVRGT